MEALQCIKCTIRHDLLFRECPLSSKLEADLKADAADKDRKLDAEGAENAEGSDVKDFSWDGLLIDDEDDDLAWDGLVVDNEDNKEMSE